MKTTILFLSTMICSLFYGQDSISVIEKNETRILTVNPSMEVRNTAGINIGVMDVYQKQTINGLNLQLNPFSFIYFLIPKAIEVPTELESTATINGFHISTGGMVDGNKLNGIGISAYHHAVETNGFTMNFFNNTSGKLNGAHVSIMANNCEIGNGITISVLGNFAEKYNGMQISGENIAKKINGFK